MKSRSKRESASIVERKNTSQESASRKLRKRLNSTIIE
jgi:hypothetical protein